MYKILCFVYGIFVGLAPIRSQFGPVKRHPNLKDVMCSNSSHKNNVHITYLSYKLQLFWSCFVGCSENQGMVLDHKQDGGRKRLIHGKVRGAKRKKLFQKITFGMFEGKLTSFGM
jgi:hypothetical protein